MATDFWASSHYKRWVVDRATLKQARAEDLQYVDDPDHLHFLAIYFANAISKLGKKLGLRQRAIATATVFFRRFYLKNSYCETDPFIVIAACCYVAAKAEESPIHIKNIVAESRALFSQEQYNVKHFPSDHTKLAEMEFYLVDDLECDLVVFHPYRTLLTLCRKEVSDTASLFGSEEGEADEAGVGLSADEGPRYWGTGEGQLELSEGALQTAWFIINDTYRSDLCLLHPPHIIAIAALYLTFILNGPTRSAVLPDLPSASAPTPRRSTRQEQSKKPPPPPQDPIAFFAGLNVSLPLIATVAQEIISLYTLWERYKEGGESTGKSPHSGGTVSPAKRSAAGSSAGTPMEAVEDASAAEGSGWNEEEYVTPRFLSRLVMRMREAKVADVKRSSSLAGGTGTGTGRTAPVNKVLERTQAAG
ncbi:putative cyclin family protein [Lyophyllum shimeji]|uniref:Cyclin family protein n=1 Tax=Lyophyllum shimeji TaxID=47721 RepID=A0A9P3PCE4_LYOSH|nr:putative cyclin family protein [Lyophyllum shimeji]